ncbi:endonuclease domain-containing protein [Patescibacteria group bacterium]
MPNLIKIQPRLPYNPKLKQRATEMRRNMTKTEQIIWFKYLKDLDVRVLRQRPIDNFIVDFYIPSLKIVIEID